MATPLTNARTPFACPTCGDLTHQSFVRSYCLGPSDSGEHHVMLKDGASKPVLMVTEIWNCDVESCRHGSHTHVRHDQSVETTVRPWDDMRRYKDRAEDQADESDRQR